MWRDVGEELRPSPRCAIESGDGRLYGCVSGVSDQQIDRRTAESRRCEQLQKTADRLMIVFNRTAGRFVMSSDRFSVLHGMSIMMVVVHAMVVMHIPFIAGTVHHIEMNMMLMCHETCQRDQQYQCGMQHAHMKAVAIHTNNIRYFFLPGKAGDTRAPLGIVPGATLLTVLP